MKKFWYRFLIIALSIGMLVPTWLTVGATKAKAAASQITVDTLIINDTTPSLTGTVEDNTAIIIIYVGTVGYSNAINGPGTITIGGLADPWYHWTLANDVISPALSEGVYDIVATETRPGGSTRDATEDELTIDLTPPVIDITSPLTGERVNDDKIITFTDSELTNPQCSVNAMPFSICVSGVTQLKDLTNFNTLVDGAFILNVRDTDLAGNIITQPLASVIKDSSPPTVPADLISTVSAGQVNLTWTASPDLDLAGYNVYRASSPYQKINISLVTTTNYTDMPGIGTFKYQVTAVDTAGNESAASNEISVDLSQLPAPTNLCAAPGDKEVTLTWDAVADASSYNVYYKKSSETAYVGPVNVLDTTTKITNLENGVKYNFIVRSVGDNGVESLDAAVEATPVAPKIVLAAAPKEVVVEPAAPEVQPTPPTVKEPTEEGKILGEETPTETETEKINWTPWIILFILIILAGAATGGYFYWFGREEEEIVSKEVIEKKKGSAERQRRTKKPTASKKNKRW